MKTWPSPPSFDATDAPNVSTRTDPAGTVPAAPRSGAAAAPTDTPVDPADTNPNACQDADPDPADGHDTFGADHAGIDGLTGATPLAGEA